MRGENRVLVIDADSILDEEFTERALAKMVLVSGNFGRVGGIFSGMEGGGFVGT